MGDFGDPFLRNQNAPIQARPKAVNRANVLQLKMMGQSHPTGLTPNLLKLFEPRPPLEYKPPPEKRKCLPYTGLAQFLGHFAQPGDPEYAPPKPEVETPAQKRARIHKSRLEEGAAKVAEELKKYDPNNDPNISGDPYKTLFVARLNYETSESKIKREFESYGPIKRVHLVADTVTNKPKGYAFIEYMHTRDMKAAYKQGDGRKIDGRRVLVDVERGRTVPNWRPRRLGGGLGTTRIGGEDAVVKEQQPTRTSLSEEPRSRNDREKSRERGREMSREQSHDKPRERDVSREDKHHRDRDRGRDRDRERDRRDRDRRDRDRGRDRARGDHDRDRRRERDHEGGDYDRDHRRSRDREPEYERSGSKHRDRSRHGERDYDHGEPEEESHGYYDGRGHSEHYEHYEHEYEVGDKYADHDRSRYDGMAVDNYRSREYDH